MPYYYLLTFGQYPEVLEMDQPWGRQEARQDGKTVDDITPGKLRDLGKKTCQGAWGSVFILVRLSSHGVELCD